MRCFSFIPIARWLVHDAAYPFGFYWVSRKLLYHISVNEQNTYLIPKLNKLNVMWTPDDTHRWLIHTIFLRLPAWIWYITSYVSWNISAIETSMWNFGKSNFGNKQDRQMSLSIKRKLGTHCNLIFRRFVNIPTNSMCENDINLLSYDRKSIPVSSNPFYRFCNSLVTLVSNIYLFSIKGMLSTRKFEGGLYGPSKNPEYV